MADKDFLSRILDRIQPPLKIEEHYTLKQIRLAFEAHVLPTLHPSWAEDDLPLLWEGFKARLENAEKPPKENKQ